MSYETIKLLLIDGLVFQKPNVSCVILNVDETGISYSIGKNGRYKKVGFDVIEAAYNELMKNGILERVWFVEKFPKQSKNSPCNFTTLGGLLQHFDLATYNKGVYIKK